MQKLSQAMAETMLATRKPIILDRWNYDAGLVLLGIEEVYHDTGEQRFFDYIKNSMDFFIKEDGTIDTYSPLEYNIDHVNNGKNLIFLYQKTADKRYKIAVDALRDQLRTHPRTTDGGYWHKNIYPHQMWLDGLYMGAAFLAQYAAAYGEVDAFDDIALQVELMAKHTFDQTTGLFCHAYDESRKMPWADKDTGHSPHFWGRAMGWFVMALCDILDYIPSAHPKREAILEIFNTAISGIIKMRDEKSGVWKQILNLHDRAGNYDEMSCSCMFVRALAKGARNKWIDESARDVAKSAFSAIVRNHTRRDENNNFILQHSCSVAGLGGVPYRDGSFEYYISEPVIDNDFKGVGPFIMAARELEQLTSNN